MAELASRWRADHINFVDDTFTWNPAWVLALCDAFQRRGLPKRVTWQCLTRVDRVGEELLRTMAAAGCIRVEMGIECASVEGLKALAKGVRREQVVGAFAALSLAQ